MRMGRLMPKFQFFGKDQCVNELLWCSVLLHMLSNISGYRIFGNILRFHDVDYRAQTPGHQSVVLCEKKVAYILHSFLNDWMIRIK